MLACSEILQKTPDSGRRQGEGLPTHARGAGGSATVTSTWAGVTTTILSVFQSGALRIENLPAGSLAVGAILQTTTMRQTLLIILTGVFFSSCKTDNNVTPAPEILPTYYTFSGQIGTYDNSTLVSADNDLIICGNSGTNLLVLKITKAGSQIWRKDILAGDGSSASGVAQTTNQ
jgi:hypothetical protein